MFNEKQLEILKGLNDKQIELVTFKDGYCISNSTSGAGKTHSLVKRVEYLHKIYGVPQEKILLMTYTKSGADTFSKRLRKLGLSKVKTGTIHSIANEIYKRNVSEDKQLILDWEKEKLFYSLFKSKYGDNPEKFDYGTINLAIGMQESNMIKPYEEYVSYEQKYMELPEEDLDVYYSEYIKYKKEHNKISFNDMIYEAIKILKKRKSSPYTHILGDEFQDSSKLCYTFMDLLSPKNQMIVGHASQSIYKFSGADLNSFLNYNKTHKPCKIINLNTNYRSCKNIVDNYSVFEKYWYGDNDLYEEAIANNNSKGIIKVYETDNKGEEARRVLSIINDCKDRGIPLNEISILYRNNSQSVDVEGILKNNNIPYDISGGGSLFKMREIKFCLGILRLIKDEEDSIALKMVIDNKSGMLTFLPKEFYKEVSSYSNLKKCTLFEAFKKGNFTSRVKSSVNSFLRAYNVIKEDYEDSESCSELIYDIYNKTGLKQKIDTMDNDMGETRRRAFLNIIEYAKNKTIEEVINYLSEGNEGEKKIRGLQKRIKGKIQMQTLHSAKGREYEVVIMIGVDNKTFYYNPQEDDYTQVNTFFVGISRPKSELYIISDYDNEFVNIMMGEK